MKHLLALMALCVAFSMYSQAPNNNYDPDWDGDGNVGVSDLLGLLGLFGDFDTDGDGVWDSVDDCTDLSACNFDSNPSVQCSFFYDAIGICGGWCETDEDGDGICDWTCGIDSVTYHGYDYATVQIGEQCWFAENMKTSFYANGEAIPNITSNTEWANATSGASCIWQNDSATYFSNYGRFYNRFAITDDRAICPSGWRVPSAADFDTLASAHGGNGTAGYHLKSAPPVWDGSGESGFQAIKTGYRRVDGGWTYSHAVYWLTDSINPYNGLNRYLTSASTSVGGVYEEQWHGFSVRCVAD